MLVPHNPLQAYRLDISDPAMDVRAERWLAGCLAYASALERGIRGLGTTAPPMHGSTKGAHAQMRESSALVDLYAQLRSLAESHDLGAVPPASASELQHTSELTRVVAAEAERRGALHSAYSLLALLERLPLAAVPIEYGRVLALRARVARKGDGAIVAEELYGRVARLARKCASDELHARALIGRGVLAQSRGNYPEAGRLYSRAARRARACGEPSLVRTAYHGLMVVAAQYGQFGRALKAGWLAFREAAGDPQVEAEMLLNLAQLAFMVGQPHAALHGFAAALAREPAPSQRLPALGGAARAAAALGDQDIVRECASHIVRYDASSTAFGYPRAAALWEVACALNVLHRHDESLICARRAQMLARTHSFHELELQTEQLIDSLTAPRASWHEQQGAVGDARGPHAMTVDVGAEGHAVLRRLTSLEHPDRVLALR